MDIRIFAWLSCIFMFVIVVSNSQQQWLVNICYVFIGINIGLIMSVIR